MKSYVIIDLEMCKVSKNIKTHIYAPRHEIIQIGAVLVNESLEITDEFITYVSPQYGVIDDFIENLTGISAKDVKGAPYFKEAMEKFMAWLPSDTTLVSWSRTDAHQIQKEVEAKKFAFDGLDRYLDAWVDCQQTFSTKMSAKKHYSLSEALIIAGINYDDGAHDALVDARNTARLFVKMEHEPELRLTPCYRKPTVAVTLTHNPFAELLADWTLTG